MTNVCVVSILCQMSEIIKVTPNSKAFPKLLKHIPDPPKQLFCRGNIKLLNTFCFGVVGTRKITGYGKEATIYIVSELSGSGMTIVSGLAMGIDAVAHQTALDNDLPTIAVLGSTVTDSGIGPRINYHLAKEILKKDGLIISEYEKNSDITKANFAIRDRIISGLCKGVLIIEGTDQSGSLITAKCAVDQNRDVFAVPGNIFSQVSVGPNNLIRTGAKLVTSAKDILEEYDRNPQLIFESNSNISTKDPVELKILDILDEKGELSADEIIRATESEVSSILSAISMLEIKNKIKNLGNGKYRKI